MHKKIFIRSTYALVFLFACIGFITTAVFIAMQFGWLNVRGSIDARNTFFKDARAEVLAAAGTTDMDASSTFFDTEEWRTVAAGIEKDRDVIERIARETGVSARLIATVAIPEQLRFFTSNRESFKRYFEPFKLLGTLNQFSLGVTGMKEETAAHIEQYAHDTESPLFPGGKFITLLPKSTSQDRFARLTDEKDHYHQYLYTAAFLAEIQAQWKHEGHAGVLTPGIITTLFNLGFNSSKPNAEPKIGGAPITLDGNTHSYGEIGEQFYYSSELPFFK